MERFLFITIDTEEDQWGGFTELNQTVKNTENIPLIQEIFDKYSAVPTYLINYPVATNRPAVRLLKNLLDQKRCDIGTHCHPWNTPPFDSEPQNEKNSFLCNLPKDLIQKKITTLHNVIKENFNYSPITFRAGRWGIGKDVIDAIHKLGYKIDTSFTPFKDWDHIGGPKFNLMSNAVYVLSEIDKDCLSHEKHLEFGLSGDCIIEIPPTIAFLNKNSLICHKLTRFLSRKPYNKFRMLGILRRLKILNHGFLSPEKSTADEMIKLSNYMFKKGHRFLNMYFHSTSLLPGYSPFVKNNNDLNNFIRNIDSYLKYISDNKVNCIGLSQGLTVLKEEEIREYQKM